jgi:streptogramin lyase
MRLFLCPIIIVAACMFAGCTGIGQTPISGASGQPYEMTLNAGRDVLQGGGFGPNWAQLTTPGNNIDYLGLTTGSDKAMWTVDYTGEGLVRISMTGRSRRIQLPNFFPQQIGVGADGDFYLNTPSGQARIARVTAAGGVKMYNLPDAQWSYGAIVQGPDHNMWFTEQTLVGRLTTAGALKEYTVPYNCGDAGSGIASGPDGNVWFTASCVNDDRIFKVNPATGVMTGFMIDGCYVGGRGIVAGPDGNLWFSCNPGRAIGKITIGGVVTIYPIPGSYSGEAQDITAGPDKNIWYIQDLGVASRIGQVDPHTGRVTVHYPPSAMGRMDSITAGPDGNIWMSSGNQMDIYVLAVLSLSPKSLTFQQPGQSSNIDVSEPQTSSWTASSSDANVATVAPGGDPHTFTVTSVGAGSCTLSVQDRVGNVARESVTVR